jgi:large subunit ribosomal protein L13
MKKSNDKKAKKLSSKKPVIQRLTQKIDATDQVLGRLAGRIALILRGKTKPTFQRHVDGGDFVLVSNVTKLKFTGKKFDQKEYFHYSGYPGGLKITPIKRQFEKDPSQVLRRAVWNMLPKNKLRAKMIKRLKISK